jgi:hypothetical protein
MKTNKTLGYKKLESIIKRFNIFNQHPVEIHYLEIKETVESLVVYLTEWHNIECNISLSNSKHTFYLTDINGIRVSESYPSFNQAYNAAMECL